MSQWMLSSPSVKLRTNACSFYAIRRLFRPAERLEGVFQVLLPMTLLGELIEALRASLGQH